MPLIRARVGQVAEVIRHHQKYPRHAMRTLSSATVAVDNPYTGETYVAAAEAGIKELLGRAHLAAEAQAAWRCTPLVDRMAVCDGAIEWFKANADVVAADISGMMGKPHHHAKGEIGGVEERAHHMMSLAPTRLADEVLPDKAGFTRRIAKEPVGTVFILAPWNYPLLTLANAVFPAVLAGNAVMIKHSPRTPLCANHYADAFSAAGAPPGLVQVANCSHDACAALLSSTMIHHVVFTGSVAGGHAIYSQAAKSTFMDVTLELGGKDPAYVAEDAELSTAIETIVDGATFNNGQSCCAIERAYVHQRHYDTFLEMAQQELATLVLGDPADPRTSLGPIATLESLVHLQAQVDDAVAKGARLLAGGSVTTDVTGKGRFFKPTLLADCTHDMQVMKAESFGPILPVMAVQSDDEAVRLMNDCDYGLTAAVFSTSMVRAERIGAELEVGTVFANRCDVLDPALPWGGVKDTGKGVSLSVYGFDSFVKLKSFHLKH